jgi:hypothetical protein
MAGWRLFDTGAQNGQRDTPISRSRWFDLGNARVNAEDKNAKHFDKKARKKAAAEQARLAKKAEKKPFFY